MILYNFIEKIMINHAFNQMMHRPIDIILNDAKIVKEKVYYPCDLTQCIIIDNVKVIINHYNLKSNKVIFYFPGGAFINSPTLLHFKYAKKISKKLNCHVLLIQYPLFPEANPKITTLLMCKIINRFAYKNIILMGDSAGANLSLMILKRLHEKSVDIVDKLIIISPWIDGNLNNENIDLIKQYDFILDKDNCKKIAYNIYFKYLDNETYLCPNNEYIYPNKVLLLSGGHEIFTPDAIKWTINQKVLKVKHLVYKNMCHCFVIFPIKEARNAIKQIKRFIYNID